MFVITFSGLLCVGVYAVVVGRVEKRSKGTPLAFRNRPKVLSRRTVISTKAEYTLDCTSCLLEREIAKQGKVVTTRTYDVFTLPQGPKSLPQGNTTYLHCLSGQGRCPQKAFDVLLFSLLFSLDKLYRNSFYMSIGDTQEKQFTFPRRIYCSRTAGISGVRRSLADSTRLHSNSMNLDCAQTRYITEQKLK